MGQVEEEPFVVVFFDEFFRLRGQAVSEVFSRLTLFELRHAAVWIAVGEKITGRRTRITPGHVDIETLILRAKTFAAEMPFADAGGNVTCGIQRLRQGHLSEWK